MVTTTTRIKTRAKVRLTSFDIIGIHTMEAPETSQTAENVARYFDNVQADAHWCVDNDSRVRVIEDQYVAWTLPGANSRSRNIELAGYARQTDDDWADAYSLAELEIAALCSAEWVIAGSIPIRRLTDAQIRAGAKGFAGHVDVNRVYKKSTHWDPGPAFPWAYFLGRVAAHVAQLNGSTAPGTVPVPQTPTPSWDNRGYSQAWIKAQQTKLLTLGYDLGADGADGKRGTRTIAATTAFQEAHGLTPDGIPGPATSAALDQALAGRPTTQTGGFNMATLPIIKNGSRGETVKAAQILLNGRGHSVGTPDGVAGPKWVTGCKSFQKAHGLVQDGECGAKTWPKLLGA